MQRTIIFGDIHGCFDEWKALLEKVDAQPEDRLVAVGDLVAKGPHTRRVLELARSLPNLRCVMGNHEAALLRLWRGGPAGEDHQQALDDLGAEADSYLRWIESWALSLDLPTCWVVHAGIRPDRTLAEQRDEDLLNLRTLEDGSPWYDQYAGPKLVVHGHWALQGLVVRRHVVGLDSGCVYGKALSAVVLPEKRIVSVPARRIYKPIDGFPTRMI